MGVKTLLAAFMGFVAALLLVYWLNSHILQTACTEYGGRYQAEAALCIDPESQYEHKLEATGLMKLAYALAVVLMTVATPLIFKQFVARLSGLKSSPRAK